MADLALKGRKQAMLGGHVLRRALGVVDSDNGDDRSLARNTGGQEVG